MDPIRDLPTTQGLGHVRANGSSEEKALRSFDAYFLGEMLKRSRSQDPTGLMDGGEAGRMYQDHLYQEFARIIAENTDFGLASTLEGHLDREADGGSRVAPEADEEATK